MATTTYFATRDSANARTDEDTAMAHVSIHNSQSLPEVQKALGDYIEDEARWLSTGDYVSAVSLRRAADLLDVVGQARTLGSDLATHWAKDSIEVAGLVFAITRTTREKLT